LQDPTLGAVGEHIDGAIGTLAHVAQTLARRLQILQQPFFADDTVTLHRESNKIQAAQTAHEHAVLPRREQLARVEDHPARRDVRIPVVDRLFHAFLMLDAAGDRWALILDAVRNRRPAVVFALAGDVHLVAAARAVLDLPQFTRHRIQRRRLHVAMTEGPDLGTDAFLADERVVLGNRSVRIEANDLAEQAVHLLGLHAAFGDRAFTLRDEERAVAIPHQAAAVVQR